MQLVFKRLAFSLFTIVTLLTGCSKSSVLSPGEFTDAFIESLQKSRPGLRVEKVQDLDIKISQEGKNELRNYLNNAYDVYQQDPSDRANVLLKYTRSTLESIDLQDKKLDTTRIIPIVKDRAWIEETRQAILAQGADKAPEHVREDLNRELIVLYAEDTENNIRYLSPDALKEAGLDTSKLREIACENLKRLLPEIKRHGEDGVYMLNAGGTFEASLLLLDFVWKDPGLNVKGDLVFAIPARDLLMVTGSEDPAGIARLREVIAEVFSENSAYRLTQKLFLYREGKIEVFAEGSARTPAHK